MKDKFLVWIFLISLFLRLYGVNFGLSEPNSKLYLNSDEKQFLVSPIIRMTQTKDLNPHLFVYPSFYLYIQAFLYFLFSFLRKAGIDFYLIGRSFSALVGSFSCVLAYFIGKEVFGRKTALLCALILAVLPLHVQTSHYITMDIPAAFLILLTVFLLLLYMRTDKLKYFYLSAVSAGLAVSTKYNFIIIFSILLAYFLKNRDKKLFNLILPASMALLLAVLFFFLGTPFALVDKVQFFNHLHAQVRQSYFGFGTQGANNINGESSFIWYLKYLFTTGAGFSVSVTAIIGLVIFLRKLDIIKIIFLYFPVLYFIQISFMATRYDRYLDPFVPFMAMFSAFGCISMLESAKIKFSKSILYKFIAIFMFVVLFGEMILKTIVFDFYAAGKDTRIESAEWVKNNLKDEGKILVVGERGIASLLEGMDVKSVDIFNYPLYLYLQQGYKYAVVSASINNLTENYKNSPYFMVEYSNHADLLRNAECVKTISRPLFSWVFGSSFKLINSSSITTCHNPEIKIFKLPSFDELKKKNYVFKALYYPYNIDANAYSSAQLVKDKEAVSGVALKNGSIFGPNDFYPAGKYEVRFGLKFMDNNIPDIIAVLDIASGGAGQKVFTRKEIRGTDFKFSKVYQDLVLDLDLPDDSSLQFRVFYPGVRDLWVEKIVVQPIL